MSGVSDHINIACIPTGTLASAAMQAGHERLFTEFDPEHPPKIRNLQALLDSDNTMLFVAVQGCTPEATDWPAVSSERYVGALTLLFLRTLTQKLAHIPHVVVDHRFQGQGLGKQMVRMALEECRLKDVTRLDLTSGASKEAAHAMYRQLGFYARDTVNWRYDFSNNAAS